MKLSLCTYEEINPGDLIITTYGMVHICVSINAKMNDDLEIIMLCTNAHHCMGNFKKSIQSNLINKRVLLHVDSKVITYDGIFKVQ